MVNNSHDAGIPEINLNRIKSLTMSKIQRDKKRRKVFAFKNRFTKVACVIVAVFVITTGSAAYAFNAEGIQNIISKITGIQQSKVLTLGEAISNKDYKLEVHEIVTDSSIGYVVVSIEALGESSKEHFDNYRFPNYKTPYIGIDYGVSELDEYREPFIRYYKIELSGPSKLQGISNDGNLRFSLDGMETPIKVSLSPTVDRIGMDITEDTTNGYQYQFNKLFLSELGLSFEAVDIDTNVREYDYKIELLFNNGTKELLLQQKNHLFESGYLLSSRGGYTNGDKTDMFIHFSKTLPLNTIKQVIINDIAFNVD